MHASRACHVYTTLHKWKYKFNKTEDIIILHFEKSTFGVSSGRVGLHFAYDERVESHKMAPWTSLFWTFGTNRSATSC